MEVAPSFASPRPAITRNALYVVIIVTVLIIFSLVMVAIVVFARLKSSKDPAPVVAALVDTPSPDPVAQKVDDNAEKRRKALEDLKKLREANKGLAAKIDASERAKREEEYQEFILRNSKIQVPPPVTTEPFPTFMEPFETAPDSPSAKDMAEETTKITEIYDSIISDAPKASSADVQDFVEDFVVPETPKKTTKKRK
jgi:hypothetical protein